MVHKVDVRGIVVLRHICFDYGVCNVPNGYGGTPDIYS